jgi:acyl-lipid omega-6 desaturase (Delta-12 desaturase)
MTSPRPSTAAESALLVATRAFTRPSWWLGLRQTAATAALLGGCLALLLVPGPGWLPWATAPLLALVIVRIFILQHDAGHCSLVPGRRANLVVGHVASVFTGIPFEPFRTEHNWHHRIQGRLDLRGLDHFDPVTDDEAAREPGARWRGRPWQVLLVNLDSLLLRRKFRGAYYMYRRVPGEQPPNHDAITTSLWFTGLAHGGLHVGVALLGGLAAWAALALAMFLSLAVGTVLMWVQHNFETVLHVEDPAQWSFVRIALEGTSYLRLPQPLRWFTADSGVHHVHHLNPAIPNYRLEEARRAIPALAEIEPLDAAQVSRCFTHAIWSRRQRRMVRYGSLGNDKA